MARRTTNLTIKAEPTLKDGKVVAPARPGRDEGKIFVLTEMSATRADAWSIKAFLALANAGADVPDDIRGAGMAGITMMTIQALSGLKFGDAKNILDEMMECVQFCPDPSRPGVVRGLIEDDIEEITTIWALRHALVELHVGFSLPDAPLRSGQSGPIALADGVITRTSPAPSV